MPHGGCWYHSPDCSFSEIFRLTGLILGFDASMMFSMRHWFAQTVTFGNYLALGGFWLAVWFYRALMVTLMGGIVGLAVSPFVKLIFFSGSDWSNALATGFIVGCQYAGIWASGVAFIWVIMDRRRIKADGFMLLQFGVGNKEPVKE